MGVFEIQAPDGKVYEVEGPTAEGAFQALQRHLGATPERQGRQRRSAPAPEVAQAKPDPFGGEADPLKRAQMADEQALANMGLPTTPRAEAQRILDKTPRAGFDAVEASSVPIVGSWADNVAGLSEVLLAGDFEQGRQRFEELARLYTEQNPDAAKLARTKGSIGGTLATMGAAPAASTARAAGAISNAAKGAGQGAVSGGIEGGVSAAGDADDGGRAEAFLQGVQNGALIGGAAAGGVNLAISGLSRGARRIMKQSAARPTVENLKAAKNQAYKAIDNAGERLSRSDVEDMLGEFEAALEASDFVEGAGAKTDIWIKRLRKMSERPDGVSVSRLDDMRSRLWKAYRQSPDEVELLDAIGAIDSVIEGKANSSELFALAREANSRFRKSELLSAAMDKAQRETDASGTGGNIANKVKQSFNSIISSERKSRFFSEAELSAMRAVVSDDLSGDIMRQIGKVSPNGNGLMQALNLGAIAVDPTMMFVSAGAAMSKTGADRRVQAKAEQVLDLVATGQQPAPTTTAIPGQIAGAVGVGASAYDE